jgi:Polysaccharide pyruvyl transferase.
VIATAPAFFATPAIMAEVARARTVVLLIGGYDGSGNYGDIAQLDAALGLLERLDPDLLLLPVLERSRLADHRALGEDFLHPPDRALFFDPGEGHEDDLLPVPAPADLAFAVCYLYGGGYLNPSWGERKLAMLRAAETLLAGGGATKVCRLSSGLQVDADWVAGLAAADAEALRSFELLGVRDRVSGAALAVLASGSPILDTADDAVGILRRLPLPDPRLNSDGKIHVNLHLAEHGWVTERPDAMASFYGDLVAELGRCAGLPVVAQPLIAYLDRQVSDRPTVERLGKACAARGVELAEPRVLRPANLADALAEMRQAALTVSCSYHVALTSLLLEVPAVLLRDNAYYEQKAAGLAEAFYLPSSFALSSNADPKTSAREIAGIVLDEQRAATVRYQLALGASRVRERRANAEVELLARLGAAATNALTARLTELSERLRERSAEPAELLAKLSLLQSENGTPPPPREVSGTPENGAAQAMLAEVMGSRSWQMTAPLRRIGARLRRRS